MLLTVAVAFPRPSPRQCSFVGLASDLYPDVGHAGLDDGLSRGSLRRPWIRLWPLLGLRVWLGGVRLVSSNLCTASDLDLPLRSFCDLFHHLHHPSMARFGLICHIF